MYDDNHCPIKKTSPLPCKTIIDEEHVKYKDKEKDLRPKTIKSFELKKPSESLNELISISPHQMDSWVPDSDVSKCQLCKDSFSYIFPGKHHCRLCGHIFCSKCSNYYRIIPEIITHIPVPPKGHDSMGSYRSVNQRVCKSCCDKIDLINRPLTIVKMLEEDMDWKKIKLYEYGVKDEDDASSIDIDQKEDVEKKILLQYYASKFCQENIYKIQFYLPFQKYSDNDRRFLYNNSSIFGGHRLWTVHYLKTLDLKDISAVKTARELLKICHCRHQMCSDTSYTFLTDEGIEIERGIEEKEEKKEKERGIEEKERGIGIEKEEDEEIFYYDNMECSDNLFENPRPFSEEDYTIQTCEYMSCGEKCDNLTLEDYINICQEHTIPEVYEYLVIKLKELTIDELEMTLPILLSIIYREMSQQGSILKNFLLTQLHHPSIQICLYSLVNSSDMGSFETFPIWLYSNLGSSVDKLKMSLDWFKDISEDLPKKFIIPTQVSHKHISLNRTDIKTINSASQPKVIPFNIGDHKTATVLYKNQDVRTDLIAQTFIKWSNKIFQMEGKDIEMKTYKVVPIDKKSGLIDIVDGKTIYAIISSGWSIQNYILETQKGSKKTIDEIRSVYINSTAAYAVVTYLMGIGDRHIDNVMIDQDNRLFHIDYEYILGDDPKIMVSPIKLNEQMIDAMGGRHSLYFKDFIRISCDIYLCLRKHINILSIILMMLTRCNYTSERIEKHIKEKFLVGASEDDAGRFFSNVLKQSCSSYISEKLDSLRYYTKENSLLSATNKIVKFLSDTLSGRRT